MAYGDYIHCCKCDVKLIYDGDRSQRIWWVDRFGKSPEIECPNCKAEQPCPHGADDACKECYDDTAMQPDEHVDCPRCGHCCPDDTALLRQALEALENHTAIKHPQQRHYRDAAIDALKERLK